jgi:predicted site-specific integrase-resolvase
LTDDFENAIYISALKTYSTQQAAKQAGIHYVTLHRWLADKKFRPSVAIQLDGRVLRRWTKSDIKKLVAYKLAHYWKR